MELSPIYPKVILFAVRGIYTALAFLNAAVISEWFEPFDGGGGTGPLLLPMTLIFMLFFAFLGWANGRILKKKKWARIFLTILLAPWSLWQIYSLLTELNFTVSAILYSFAALVSLVPIALLYQQESNAWFHPKSKVYE